MVPCNAAQEAAAVFAGGLDQKGDTWKPIHGKAAAKEKCEKSESDSD
jgi:hypothetical protein